MGLFKGEREVDRSMPRREGVGRKVDGSKN